MNTKISLSDLILLSLEKAVDGYVKLEDFTYNPGKYLYGYPRLIKKSSMSQALRRLRIKGWVDFIDQEKLLIKITSKGELNTLSTKINPNNDSEWDRKWRIVLFDIPEKKRAVRDLLRVKLREWGFKKWQNSIWVTKTNCFQEFRNFIKYLGIENWVKIIESEDVNF